MRLCFAKDRLYLVERDYDNVNNNVDTVALAMQARGQRVLVLSLQGDILQVVRLTHPTEASTASTAEVRSICCFDNKSYWRDTFTLPLIAPALARKGMGCSCCRACTTRV
jgi:hypothetical protein